MKTEATFLKNEFIDAFLSEQLDAEQPLISKKESRNAYSVERNYVNSKAYHDKFESLPVNKDVQQSLYIQAGRLLEFVDGQEQERLIAVNARTGEFIVDNFNREGSIRGTGFNEVEAEKLLKCKDSIVLLHNHSLNGRPSAQDLITYLNEDIVRISLIICHDGTVYGIYEVKPEFKIYYEKILDFERQRTSDIDEAKRMAATMMYQLNEKLGDRHKLFMIKKL
ncbi:MAG: hypothetical protein ACI4KB_08905 [Oscillospiraceae bacterium]|nr:hypothetical protein [Oscillospiraceae bacterium]